MTRPTIAQAYAAKLAAFQRHTPFGKPLAEDRRAPPGPDRWKVRSKTFAGMAEAWADQWGGWALEVAA